ncbi:hypothetical protein SteCoe_31560 [Stentor coeruleus]|uniref:Receptor ligand binding region domain-containing protein n=1 Tax=Stentor coeruleus TaxID=5963 RepID=A0A1R2B0Z5_9CILI|nr:hypothetical protein SteCoe_31560 [Stentor coeruleus]
MGGLVFLIQFFIAAGVGVEEGIVFISNETPDQVKKLYSDAGLLIDVSFKTFDEIYSTLEMQNHLFMVDVTWTKSYLGLLNSLSESFGMAYFTSSVEITKFSSRFSLHNTEEDEAYSISSLLSYLGVENYVLLSSANQKDQKSSKFLSDITHRIIYSHITYPEELPLSVAEDIIGKMIKAKGIKALVIIDSTNSLTTIEQAMVSKKYIKSGTIVIYSSKSFNHELTNGILKIEEHMAENAKNLYEFDYFALISRLSKAKTYVENTLRSSLDKENLILALSSFNQDTNLYSIINIQNTIEIPVGAIHKTTFNTEFQCEINSTIYFPGNITQITTMKTKLLFSIANGTNDPYYSFNYPVLAYDYQGANHAVARSNNYNEIPNFYIELFPTDCGMFWYDPYWYQSCYGQIIDNMGIAMVSSFFGEAIKGNILTMRTFSKVIPQVSPLGLDSTLDSKEDYPELVKLEAKFEIYVSSRMTVLMSLGYTDLIFLSSNETEELKERMKLFKYLITSSGMRIINDEDHMYIQYNYTRTDYNKYIKIFQYLKETRCTVYFISVYFLDMAIEALYDIGLRKGDFVYITDSGAVSYLDGIEEPYATKRRELIQGALVLSYREYVGDYGETIKKELLQMYNEITYMCMTFDTVSVIKEAIIYLLSTGDDYEDYNKLMSAIRKNKIVGCLGNVYFDIDGNTRASSQFLIQQIYYNSTLKTFGTIEISYIDRFSSQLITIINPYIWPTNSAPPNYRPYSPCPFDSYKIQSSSKGKTVLYALSSLYFIICLISCIVTSLKLNRKISPITEKKNISFDDYLYFLYFPLQFFQIIAMGPDQLAYKHFIKNFETIFSLDFNLYFNVEFDEFWYLFYFVFGFTIFWIFGCLLFWSKFGSSMNRFWLAKIIRLIVPVVGHLAFMPIISMLMNIYLCIEGTSDEITDSFLFQDCRVMCYHQKHKTLATLTGIILIIFIPLAVFNRSLWETAKESLHLQTKSNYLIIISLSQICLALLNKTLKIYNQEYHGIVCCFIIFGLLVFTIFYKPYNYSRAAVSQCISLTAGLWALITATIFRNNASIDIWIIIEIVGLLFVLIIGLAIFKKFPQLLISEKGIDISTLFLFQFCKNYEKFIKDPKSLKIIMSEEKYKMIESSKAP